MVKYRAMNGLTILIGWIPKEKYGKDVPGIWREHYEALKIWQKWWETEGKKKYVNIKR